MSNSTADERDLQVALADKEPEDFEQPSSHKQIPQNALPMERVHSILQRMSQATKTKQRKKKAEESDNEDDKALRQSTAVSDA